MVANSSLMEVFVFSSFLVRQKSLLALEAQVHYYTGSNRRLQSLFQHWKAKQKFATQHFAPELLDRRDMGLPA